MWHQVEVICQHGPYRLYKTCNCKCKCKFNVKQREYLRNHPSQRLMIKCLTIPDRIGIWKCWFLRRGEDRSTRRKTSRCLMVPCERSHRWRSESHPRLLYHWCNVAITRVVVKDISSGSSLDGFNFVYDLLPEWIPYTGRVFDFRPYKIAVCRVFNFMATTAQYSAQRTQSWASILQMLSLCSFQLKLLDIVTPRYFVELTFAIGKQFKVYWNKIEDFFTCYSEMVTFFNVKVKFPAFWPWR